MTGRIRRILTILRAIAGVRTGPLCVIERAGAAQTADRWES